MGAGHLDGNVMLKRQVFRDIIKQKILGLELGWIGRRAAAYAALKVEKFLKNGKAPGPLMAVLILTENCNLRCPMCELPGRFKENPDEMGTAVWKRVIDDLHAMRAAGIGFTGGEVTLREDIFDLIAHARRHGMPVTLNTNALALTDRRLDDMIKADPTNINISIDSGRDHINDELRGGKRVLARTLERIERFVSLKRERGARYAVTVVTVLSDLNITDLEVLFKKVSDAGADRIGFMPLHYIGPGKCVVAPVEEDTSGLAETIRSLSRKYGLSLENSDCYLDDFHPVMSGSFEMPVTCNAGYTSIVIGPDLQIYRCWPYFEKGQPFRRWDPETSTLREIWNDEVFRKERLESLSCKECFWNCHAEISYLIRM
jgi:radical SAM protein with 4Fe4S-binding SPASM domain